MQDSNQAQAAVVKLVDSTGSYVFSYRKKQAEVRDFSLFAHGWWFLIFSHDPYHTQLLK